MPPDSAAATALKSRHRPQCNTELRWREGQNGGAGGRSRDGDYCAGPYASGEWRRGRSSDLLTIGGGAYNVCATPRRREGRLQYDFPYRFLYIIRPILGVLATNNRTVYGYGGFRFDAEISRISCCRRKRRSASGRAAKARISAAPRNSRPAPNSPMAFPSYSRLGLMFVRFPMPASIERMPGAVMAMMIVPIPRYRMAARAGSSAIPALCSRCGSDGFAAPAKAGAQDKCYIAGPGSPFRGEDEDDD